MSLINDALKKAQKRQADEAAEPVPMPGSGGRVAQRGQAANSSPRSNTVVLLGAGAVFLGVGALALRAGRLSRETAAATSPAARAHAERREVRLVGGFVAAIGALMAIGGARAHAVGAAAVPLRKPAPRRRPQHADLQLLTPSR